MYLYSQNIKISQTDHTFQILYIFTKYRLVKLDMIELEPAAINQNISLFDSLLQTSMFRPEPRDKDKDKISINVIQQLEPCLTSKANALDHAARAELMVSEQLRPLNENLQMDKVHQFTQAWKSESNFSILLIEKLSLIVNNYFKMLAQSGERNRQIGVLIVYNKSLIEILNKFEDHQRKLIHKLKTMEEFNCKIMKQLCAFKKRDFKAPQLRTQQSIFIKFSLKALTFIPPIKPQSQLSNTYKSQLQKLFKQYLLQPNLHLLPVINQQITKLQQKQQKFQPQQIYSDKYIDINTKIQDLHEIISNIQYYNKQISNQNISCDNMFDLYQLKWEIKTQIKNMDIDFKEIDKQKQDSAMKERLFVENVRKAHASLSSMNQNQLQGYLKKQKQIRKKFKKQRVKQQQMFVRVCQDVQNQNIQLRQDKQKLRKRIIQLQDLLSKSKAQLQIKNMKRMNKSSNDESMFAEASFLAKKQQKQKQIIKIKEQIQKEKKQVYDNKIQQFRRNMIAEIKKNQINIQDNVKLDEIVRYLMEYLRRIKTSFKQSTRIKLQKPVKDGNIMDKSGDKEDDIVSPCLDDKSLNLGFSVSSRFLRASDQKNLQSTESLKKLQNEIQQLKRKNQELMKNNQQIKMQSSKQIIKVSQEIKKKQQYCKKLQKLNKSFENNFVNKQNEFKKQIEQKLAIIRQVENQNKNLQQQIKCLTERIKQLQKLNESAQKLSQKLVKAVQVLITQDFTSEKFLVLMDQMLANLQKYVDDYKKQTNKQFMTQLTHTHFHIDTQTENRNLLTVKDENTHKNNNRQKQINKVAQIGINTQSIMSGSSDDLSKIKNKTINKQNDSKESQKQNNLNYKSTQLVKRQFPILPKNSQRFSQKFVPEKLNLQKQSIKFSTQKVEQRSRPSSGIDGFNDTNSITVRGSEKKYKTENISSLDGISSVKMESENCKASVTFKNSQFFVNQVKNHNNFNADLPPSARKIQYKLENLLKLSDDGLIIEKSNQDIEFDLEPEKTLEQMTKTIKKQNSGQKNGLKASKIKKTSSYPLNNQVSRQIQTQVKIKISPAQQQKKIASPQLKRSQKLNIIQQKSKLTKLNNLTNFGLNTEVKSKPNIKKQCTVNKNAQLHTPQSSIILNNSINNTNLKSSNNNQVNNKNSKNSINNDNLNFNNSMMMNNDRSFASSRPPQMNQINLSLSLENMNQKDLANSLAIMPNQYLNQLQPSRKQPVSSSKLLDRSALSVGIQLIYVQKMFDKFKRLNNQQDALDFYQLFKLYKQALKCLQKAQLLNRYNQIRYRKFIDAVINQKQIDPSYSVQQQLYKLKRYVSEQEETIIQQKDKFQQSYFQNIKVSQKNVSNQLKILRMQYFRDNQQNSNNYFRK